MIFEYMTMKLIWWLLTVLLMVGFAVTGGMDIGVNILLPVIGKTNDDKRLILNSIGPTWEGNQVWLITFGATLFAVWPTLYATAFSSLYLALLIVVVMLILRPPSFDYRAKIDSVIWRRVWDSCLFASGVVLALIFGAAVGNLFTGLPFYFDSDMRVIYQGNFFTLLSPITLVFGLVALSMFVVQGGLFLQYKLDAKLAKRAQVAVKKFGGIFIICFVAAGIYIWACMPTFKLIAAPDLNSSFAVTNKIVQLSYSGWLNNFKIYAPLWALPCSAIIGTLLAIIFSNYAKPVYGLLFNSLAIIGTICTAAVAIFPFMLPSNLHPNHSLTVWDASSSHRTLSYTLWVLLILLPIVLLYTSWVYRVMRGKVKLQPSSY